MDLKERILPAISWRDRMSWKKAYFILLALVIVLIIDVVRRWGAGDWWRLADIHWLSLYLPEFVVLSLLIVTIFYSRELTRLKAVILVLFTLGVVFIYLFLVWYSVVMSGITDNEPRTFCRPMFGVFCLKFQLKTDTIDLTLQNGHSGDLQIEEFVVYGQREGIPVNCVFAPFVLTVNETRRIISSACSQPLGKPSDTVDLRVNIRFRSGDPRFSDFPQRGEIRGTIT